MENLEDLLGNWGIPDAVIKSFKENGIEVQQFKYLTDDLLKELCPAIGTRLNLRNKIQEYITAQINLDFDQLYPSRNNRLYVHWETFFEKVVKIRSPSVKDEKISSLISQQGNSEENDYIRPFVRVGPAGYLAMPGYADHAQDIYNLQVRPDDIWVTSFSRSGTTWLQELVWLVANDLDFDAAKKQPLITRYAFLEYPTQDSEKSKPPPTSSKRATVEDFRTLPGLPSPRFVKSHLPLSLLPPMLLDNAKVFYIARDARDVAVSFHFAHKLFRYFDDDVTIKEFWDLFKKDLIMHTPLFPHVKEAWERRDHPNLMFLFYEELQQDLPAAIDKVSAFLGKQYSPDQKQRLAEHLSFSNMKKTDFSKDKNEEKTFFRKGQSGGWVQYFDEDMKKEAEDYISHQISLTDMRFPERN